MQRLEVSGAVRPLKWPLDVKWLMYELKKNGKVLTSKFVGTGPSSYKKKNLPGRGLTKVEKHWTKEQER
jgi:hypothetical protein